MKRTILLVIIAVLQNCRTEEPESGGLDRVLGFSQAIHPVSFDQQRDSARDRAGRLLIDAVSCKQCHKQIYDNWAKSRHRVAFTNRLYQESHERENLDWCVNCHAPLLKPGGRANNPADRVLTEEGISCNVCHVRAGRIITGRSPQLANNAALYHEYTIAPEMKTEEACANCHQFNFPNNSSSQAGGPVVYSTLPMQNTVNEWRGSFFAGRLNCNSCHLMPGSKDSHSFPGGHDPQLLSESLRIEAEFLAPGQLSVTVLATGIGHAFPTGDLFRALRLRIVAIAPGPRRPLGEQIFLRDFRPRPTAPEDAPKYLALDTTIPAPIGDHLSVRRTEFSVPVNLREIEFELYLDYLNSVNHLLTAIPLKERMPLVKRGRIRLKPPPKVIGEQG